MPPRTILRLGTVTLLAFTVSCADESTSRPGASQADPARGETPETRATRSYERAFVFTTLEEDTTVLVPIFFSARTASDDVVREIRGWLGRTDAWEAFAAERWVRRVGRAPWRIVPRGAVRIVVGEDDVIETVIYRDPPRILELDLARSLVEWTGPRGGTYRLEEASLLLGNRTFSGLALDVSRARSGTDPPGGDWGLLVSGDSLQLVLASPERTEPGADGAFLAFLRLDFREIQWPDITVDWTESRAFEPARQDVPAAWRFHSRGREIEGALRVESSQLMASDGEGPVLPVEALFSVSGTVRTEGREYPVRGFFRHRTE